MQNRRFFNLFQQSITLHTAGEQPELINKRKPGHYLLNLGLIIFRAQQPATGDNPELQQFPVTGQQDAPLLYCPNSDFPDRCAINRLRINTKQTKLAGKFQCRGIDEKPDTFRVHFF